MKFQVVDENVLIVANGNSHADDECLEHCIDFLLACRDAEALVVDDNREILARYAKHCSHSGQPGTGDLFFVWARDNAGRLRSTPLSRSSSGSYESLPSTIVESEFDRDDFIWLAAAKETSAVVVNAVDSDYSHYAQQLLDAGIDVRELCPQQLKPLMARRG